MEYGGIYGFDFMRSIVADLRIRGPVKLPAHRARLPGHAVASRMRANEISFFIVPFDPAYKAGLAGHLSVKKGCKHFR
jgi:hypothetical protein